MLRIMKHCFSIRVKKVYLTRENFQPDLLCGEKAKYCQVCSLGNSVASLRNPVFRIFLSKEFLHFVVMQLGGTAEEAGRGGQSNLCGERGVFTGKDNLQVLGF